MILMKMVATLRSSLLGVNEPILVSYLRNGMAVSLLGILATKSMDGMILQRSIQIISTSINGLIPSVSQWGIYSQTEYSISLVRLSLSRLS